MIKAGKWIAKHKKLILFIGLVLLVPSVFGYVSTRVNYDVLSYLPETLETVEGQDIMVDEFGMGAFSMVVVEDMGLKDVAALKEKIQNVDHVEDVLWYDSVMDLSVPIEMLPKDLKEGLFKGNATMMIALFDNTTSSDEAMDAVTEMRSIVSKNCFISGMTGVVTDIKALALKEMPVYVVIAGALSLLVLFLAMDSLVVPILFLLSIGIAIVYNMGTNIFLGEISYITQALTAVLQLGVTMDYSIFLLNCYEDNKKRFPGDKDRAMAHAISNTFKSVVGSSVTTIAGFIALCFMTFALGRDMGIVMAKGVVIGVICCVTLLPSMILICDKAIEKTRHKVILPDLSRIAGFITKHHVVFVIAFLVVLIPAIYGYTHTNVYYDLTGTLPETFSSKVGNDKLSEQYHMGATHMVLAKSSLSEKDSMNMIDEIKKVDGVKLAVSMDSLTGPMVPQDVIPDDVKDIFKSGDYQMMVIVSEYASATDEVNKQCDEINAIIKKYDNTAMLIGEAPCTKDLIEITDVDFKNVSIISIAAIFIIILLTFKSISLPIILVCVIEFAIFINMGIPAYTGTVLPFIASIVIGTIQLGATVDYAILMTNKYKKNRFRGMDKKEAITDALSKSIQSIIVSALSFFAATFGVGLYSNIDMIGSLCMLMARGAIISMIVVIFILPSMFMVFDRVICASSAGFRNKIK